MRRLAVVVLLVSASARAQWLDGFTHRQPIAVTSVSAQADYQLEVTLDTASLLSAGRLRAGCPDLRFTAPDGVTVLPHWQQGACDRPDTRYWVRVPALGTATTLYAYYGNDDAAAVSDPARTMLFFEPFDEDPNASDSGRWLDIYRANGDPGAEWAWKDAGEVWMTDLQGGAGSGATVAFMDAGWEDGWACSFRYRIGGGGAGTPQYPFGGDGMALGFFHDDNFGTGNELALQSPGYAVEIDGVRGNGDTNDAHLAVVQTRDTIDGSYHFAQFDTQAVHDDRWHAVLVAFSNNRITVGLDDAGTVMDYTPPDGGWDRTFRRLVFAAGSGGAVNIQRLDDVVLRKFVRPPPQGVVQPLEAKPLPGPDGGSDGGSTVLPLAEVQLGVQDEQAAAGQLTGLITVRLRNSAHVEAPAPSPVTVMLTSTSGRSGFVLKTSDKIDQPLTVVIPAGASTAGVYYRDFAPGRPTLTASSQGLSPGTATLEITEAEPKGCGCTSTPWAGALLLVTLLSSRLRRAAR